MATRNQVIDIIRANQSMLTDLGVVHVAVFGAVARGDDRPGSDVDIMIEVDPAKVHGILGLGRIQVRFEKMVGRSVDLARRDRLRPHVAVEAEKDAVHAF